MEGWGKWSGNHFAAQMQQLRPRLHTTTKAHWPVWPAQQFNNPNSISVLNIWWRIPATCFYWPCAQSPLFLVIYINSLKLGYCVKSYVQPDAATKCAKVSFASANVPLSPAKISIRLWTQTGLQDPSHLTVKLIRQMMDVSTQVSLSYLESGGSLLFSSRWILQGF